MVVLTSTKLRSQRRVSHDFLCLISLIILGKGQSPRPWALCGLLGCELLRLFCGNSHPSNSHSASDQGEAKKANADSCNFLDYI
jgi:hypothetical protein